MYEKSIVRNKGKEGKSRQENISNEIHKSHTENKTKKEREREKRLSVCQKQQLFHLAVKRR